MRTELQTAILRAQLASKTPQAVMARPTLELVPIEPVVVVAEPVPEPSPSERIARLEAEIAAIKAAFPGVYKEPAPTVYPTMAKIKDIVGRYYNVSNRELESSGREIRATFARQVVMYLAKRMTIKSFPEIGRLLGGRDHTTILHGFRKISLHRQDIATDIDRLERAIATGTRADGDPVTRWVGHKPPTQGNRVVVPYLDRRPKSNGWTSHEDLRLTEMRSQGLTIKAVARVLGRTYEATQTHMKKMRERASECPVPPPTNLPHGKTRSEHAGSSR